MGQAQLLLPLPQGLMGGQDMTAQGPVGSLESQGRGSDLVSGSQRARAKDAGTLLSNTMRGSLRARPQWKALFPETQLLGCYLSLFPYQPQNPRDTASQPKPLRFFRKRNLSQNHDLFSGCK